jgi:hypothetical protein
MLAYVFWHRPRSGVDTADYEAGLRELHEHLSVASASFRLTQLPFAAGSGPGYEDWYLVEDWAEVGELNAAAVTGEPREPHDAVARQMGAGWGGLYALIRGEAAPPATARWIDKPLGEDADAFLGSLGAPTIWRRQMVLGPAPEFCLVEPGDLSGRRPV